jgi:DoxX-like family
MTAATDARKPATAVWIGRAMSGLIVLFLIMDRVMKLIDPTIAQQTEKQLGFPPALDRPLGFLAVAIVILSALPGTAFSSAVLLTGYLGGAIASHLRVGDLVFTDLLFNVYIGLLAWGALRLRSLSRL